MNPDPTERPRIVPTSSEAGHGGLVPYILPCVILVWRAAVQPWTELWRDWTVVLAVFLLSWPRARNAAARDTLVLASIAYLFGLFFLGHGPHILSSVRVGP